MLSRKVLQRLADQIELAERKVLAEIADGRASQEDHVTGSLITRIQDLVDEVDGVTIRVKTLPSAGQGAEEAQRGADIEGFIVIHVDDVQVRKGFLVQSKQNNADGVRLNPPSEEDFGHWLYDGDLHLARSGSASVGLPSEHLAEQCEKMLGQSPASYVWIYSADQVGVVSASAIRAARGKPKRAPRTPLGTKTLADFFVHLAQSYLGDERLAPTFSVEEASLQSSSRAQIFVTIEGQRELPQAAI